MNIKKAYQKMTDELEASLYGYSPKNYGDAKDAANFAPSPACSHDWADYQGLTEAFTYCVKCDQKKR